MEKDKIIIVDNDKFTGGMLKKMFAEKYSTEVFTDGVTALGYINLNSDDVVMLILRLNMPQIDARDFIKALDQKNIMSDVPKVIIADSFADDVSNECYNLGVMALISKPFAPVIVKRRLESILDLYTSNHRLQYMVDRQVRLISDQNSKLKKYQNKLIETLSDILEFRNLEPNLHVQRIEQITELIANSFSNLYPVYQLTSEKIETIVNASVLHDIGKICIPDNILLKPGRLSDQEFELVKSHTTKGCEIVERLEMIEEHDFAEVCRQIVRHHHERFDGSGYPDGLVGEEIPLPAQIVSLADAYDGLVSNSIYKRGYSHEKAYNMIMNGECGAFSDHMLGALTKVRKQIEGIYDNI